MVTQTPPKESAIQRLIAASKAARATERERKEQGKLTPRPEVVAARKEALIADAKTQRGVVEVEKELKTLEKKLSKKRADFNESRLKRFISASADIRLIREAKALKLGQEVTALTEKQKALKAERPLARRADDLRKELGIRAPGMKEVPKKTTKKPVKKTIRSKGLK